MPVFSTSDSLDDCLLDTRREDDDEYEQVEEEQLEKQEHETLDENQDQVEKHQLESELNQSRQVDESGRSVGAYLTKSPSIRSKSASPRVTRCIKESIHCSSLVCLASLGVLDSKQGKQLNWTQGCNCSDGKVTRDVNESMNKGQSDMITSTSTVSHHHHHHHQYPDGEIDLLKSARSRLTMISNSSDLYNFHPNSPVSFNVRDLKEDMDILTISRTDNPYLAAKLDLLSETAERSLLVSPCSLAHESSGNLSTNASNLSRGSTVALHPLLQSRMSSCDRTVRYSADIRCSQEGDEEEEEADDADDVDDALESSELLLINACDETVQQTEETTETRYTTTARGRGNNSTHDSRHRVDSIDISLDNLLDDASNLHEMMIRSPPPQFPTKLASFIFPDGGGSGNGFGGPSVTTSPVRSLHHHNTSSPITGARSVLGWRSRYPPIEKASSDTSAVLSPRLLAAVAKLTSNKDATCCGNSNSNSKMQTSNTSSTSNILTGNMLPSQIRRLTRRASSGTSCTEKLCTRGKFQ